MKILILLIYYLPVHSTRKVLYTLQLFIFVIFNFLHIVDKLNEVLNASFFYFYIDNNSL